jgi:DNA-binding NarL/FixJ family response regulator
MTHTCPADAELMRRVNELQPDVVVIDVSMTQKYAASLQSACNGSKLLAISFADDQKAGELAHQIGASELLDKMNLTEQLVPTIRQSALGGTP